MQPQIQSLLDDAIDFLKSNGINAKIPDDATKPRTYYVQHMGDLGVDSLIYLTLDILAQGITGRSHFTVQCFDKDGKELWKEQPPFPGFSMGGPSALVKALSKSMRPKLLSHIGNPGLIK
jgi:hypothetical protein